MKGKAIAVNKNKQTSIENSVKGFRVNFSSLSFLAPDELTYQTRLIGYSNKWSSWSNEPFVDYGNIPPGSYKLQVRTKNLAGLTGQISSMRLYIEPFWYQTWWALLLFVLIFAGIITRLVYWRIRTYRKRSKLFEKRVVKRTRELSRSRDKVLQQSKRLRELDQLKNQFYTKISHEFRTPLTLILGPVQNVLDANNQNLPVHVQKKLEPVLNGAQRLHRLVDQLLEIAKIESEDLTLTASPNDLTVLIRKIASSFESHAENEDISLRVALPDTPCYIYYDPEHLETVLTNLLSNAIRFTSAGGTIKIDLHETNDAVIINVKDNGIGIDEADLAHIFDRFYQVNSTIERHEEGMGLGLTLSHQLIELHHGRLDVKSIPYEGSIFTIRLLKGKKHFKDEQIIEEPQQQSNGHRDLPPQPTVLNDSENGEQETPINREDQKTLLIIDDNQDLCRYVRDVMMDDSYQIIEAYNGKEGIDLVKDDLPDVILCDVMMPEMDGFTFSQKLKEDSMTASIPIIFLTGRADKEGRLEGLESGADDYITKPFDAELLQARVKNVIEQRLRLQRQLQQGQLVTTNERSQSPFEMRVRTAILENLTNYQFGVKDLAQEVAISKSHLNRKLKDETDKTASSFIRTVRLEQAAEMLKNREGNISEVAYSVGFNSLSYFSRSFKKHFDASPSEFLD